LSYTEESIKEAKKLASNGEYKRAIKILENLFRENPNSDLIKIELINILFLYGFYLNDDWNLKYEEAVSVFKRIIRIDPRNYRALYNLGLAYHNLGKNTKALDYCDKALQIKPNHKFCYYSKGMIYESMEKYTLAMENYKKAKKIDPNFHYANQAIKDMNFVKERIQDHELREKNIEKLSRLLKISEKINIQLIQEILDLPKEILIEIILELGNKFQFKLNGNFLKINSETLESALEYLTKIYLKD